MSTKRYAFFRFIKATFPYPMTDSITFQFKLDTFIRKMDYAVMDQSKNLNYNKEFPILFNLERSPHLKIQIITSKKLTQETVIGKRKIDLANLVDPLSRNERRANIKLSDKTSVTLFYNIVIVPQSDYPSGMPINFFTTVTEIKASDISQDTKRSPSASKIAIKTSSQRNFFQLTPKSKPNPLKNSSNPSFSPRLPSGNLSPRNYNANLESNSMDTQSSCENQGSRDIHRHLISDQESVLNNISFRQCQHHFNLAVFKYISCPRSRDSNYSKELMKPLLDFSLFEITSLTEKSFDELMEPLRLALDRAIARKSDYPELVALFSTILHFGFDVIREGITHQPIVYNNTLKMLEDCLNKILDLITQHLIADSAATNILDVLPSESSDSESRNISSLINFRFGQLKGHAIPFQVINLIKSNICNCFDVRFFEKYVDEDLINDESANQLFKKNCLIRTLYDHESFTFQKCDDVIQKTRMLLRDPRSIASEQPSPLLRLIASKIQPLQLPRGMTIDSFGPAGEGSQFRIEMNNTNTKNLNFDDILNCDPTCLYDNRSY